MNYEKEKKKYEKRYEEQTRELLVLTGEYVGGGAYRSMTFSSAGSTMVALSRCVSLSSRAMFVIS